MTGETKTLLNVSGQAILQKLTRRDVFAKQADIKFAEFLNSN
jgi:hypothetical protein